VSFKDATSSLRALAAQLDSGELDSSEAAVAQFLDALDTLLARARRYRPQSTATGSGDDPARGAACSRVTERSLRITQESVDSAPIGIFRLDSVGRIVSANRCARESLGYTSDEILQLTIFDIDPDFPRERWNAHRELIAATGARHLTSRHRRKDGTIFPVDVSIKMFTFDDEVYSVSFAKDLTESFRAEQERRKLEDRMLQAQKLESLGVLAGGIAHDFNNLLMVMIGNLDLALRELSPTAPQQPLLQDADKAARQAADLCRQLLIYAGKGRGQMQPVELGEVLQEQAHMLEVSASKSARLVLALADDLPYIQADVSQLRQVFMNLIINASDALGQSPGVITLTTRAVLCDRQCLDGVEVSETLKPGRYVCVEVSDTGSGMSEEVRGRIFDPFFSTKTSSRGLGLAAVRGIVQNHGGGIHVRSELGKGTTFKLLFPVPDTLDTAPPSAPRGQPWQGHGLVLLVDDEEALRHLGKRMLARLGFETLTARNGAEALALFREHRQRIRYVLLDWSMPEMGGSETFAELRHLDPHLPVILTSGHAPEDIMQRLTGEPVTTFVRKPYILAELAEAFRATSGEGEGT
jgi:two-component system, cell cycle sensor histidine kinase and response regulator CckA